MYTLIHTGVLINNSKIVEKPKEHKKNRIIKKIEEKGGGGRGLRRSTERTK